MVEKIWSNGFFRAQKVILGVSGVQFVKNRGLK
jgi:hypothetical protein